jgi:type IV pilus assembly protein PilW
MNRDAGYTLVELMVGMSIALLIGAAAFAVATTSERASTANERTTEMQQNARVAMDFLTQDIKMAGYGQTGMVGCATGIVPADNTPAGPDTGPDSVSMIVPTPLSTLALAAGAGGNTAQLQAGAVAAINAAFAPEVFGIGSWITMTGAWTSQVTNIAGDVLTFGANMGMTAAYPTGTPLTWLRCVTYSIGTTTAACAGNPPCLLRGSGGNNIVIAEGIEDLQLAYACDGCNGSVPDGIVEDFDVPANPAFTAGDFVSNNAWGTPPMTADTIRLVRVTIVARQQGVDLKAGDTTQIRTGTTAPIIAEDHNPTAGVFVAGDYNATTYQQQRRRSITRTVQLRNVGL